MARLRKFVCYRRIDRRPYTRRSKYKEQSFIRASPATRVVSFETGNKQKKKFGYTLELKTKVPVQIRGNALESARQTSTRALERTIGNSLYYLKIKPYPHHVLRENPIAAGAGADRFSTGMKKSFGKPIGVAARLKEGQTIFQVSVDKPNLGIAKTALERASKKLPCSCSIQVTEN